MRQPLINHLSRVDCTFLRTFPSCGSLLFNANLQGGKPTAAGVGGWIYAEHPRPTYKRSGSKDPYSATFHQFQRFSSASDSRLLVTSNRCDDDLVPVGKLLASRGLCSRGEGDEFFSLGLVLLNGRRLERNEAYVHMDAPVDLAPRAKRLMQQKVTVLLHKPMHFLSCQTEKQVFTGTSPSALVCLSGDGGISKRSAGDKRELLHPQCTFFLGSRWRWKASEPVSPVSRKPLG